MSISVEQKKHVLNLLRKKYVDWDGFHHQAFRRDEIHLKRSTVKKAVSFLSESMLAQLLVTRDTEAFIDRLELIGKATPLLNSNEHRNGDLEILYVTTLDKPVFCAQVYHLLHGTEPVVERLDAYLEYIEAHELPNTWTFPTYFLQFCFPDTEFFVMPRPTEWFLKHIGSSASFGKPAAATYKTIREYAHSLKHALSEYRPQDMIDIQSVVHVCSVVSEPALQSVNGYDEEDELLFLRNKEHEHLPAAEPAAEDDIEISWPPSASYDSDSTMLHISEVSDESDTEIRFSNGTSSPASSFAHEGVKEGGSYPQLFKRFINTYMTSPAGVARAAAYAKSREQAEQNFAQLIADHELGEKVTDRVFLHLLPHADTEENQKNGAWVHPVYEPAARLLSRLEKKFANQQGIREQVGQVLLEFIRHCVYKSDALDKSSKALARLEALSLMDVSSITPILHALKPTQYMLLHDTSIDALNRLNNTAIEVNLNTLPGLNSAGLQLIKDLKREARVEPIPSVYDTDLFDIFTHWMAANAEAASNDHQVASAPSAARVSEANRFSAASTPHRSQVERKTVPSRTMPYPNPVDGGLPLEECAEETGFPVEVLHQWIKTLERKKQIIFYGPACTGKSYMARQIARRFTNGTDGIVQHIEFYPGYAHEDFIGTNNKPGVFHAFCTKAAQHTGPGVLIIDDINRSDTVAIFGELFGQLDRDADTSTILKQPIFSLPANVFIIGTMVPGGREDFFSDVAARRRFAMIPLMPNYDVLERFHRDTNFQVEGLIRALNQINVLVENPRYQIGTAYFLRQDLLDHIEEIWRYEVEPGIEGAFAGDPEKAEAFRWDKVRRQFGL